MRKKRFVVLVDRDSYLPDTGQTVKTRTMVCCASFVTTMNLKNCHLKWYSGQTVMFVELGYTPTVLLAPIRSPANLNVKIVGQIFLSFCFFLSIVAFLKFNFIL